MHPRLSFRPITGLNYPGGRALRQGFTLDDMGDIDRTETMPLGGTFMLHEGDWDTAEAFIEDLAGLDWEYDRDVCH